MPDYITPEQCEAFSGCKTFAYSRFTDYHIPASEKGGSWMSIRLHDTEGFRPNLWVNDRPCLFPPTLSNVRRLLSALRGEMSDAEMAWEVVRVIEDDYAVLLRFDDTGFYSVWSYGCRTTWGAECHIVTVGHACPLAAARAAANELGVELPEHLRGGE